MAVATQNQSEGREILHSADVRYERVSDRVQLSFRSYKGENCTAYMTVHDAVELAEKLMELGSLLSKLDEFGE